MKDESDVCLRHLLFGSIYENRETKRIVNLKIKN